MLLPAKSIDIIFLLVFLFTFPAFLQGQPPETQALLPGKKLERALTTGETHSYKISLKTGEYLRIDILQSGIDIELSILDPDGKIMFTRDRPTGKNGVETLSLVAAVSGVYQLNVKALEGETGPGGYKVENIILRIPNPEDLKQIEAENLFQEGRLLQKTRTIEALGKACVKYGSAAESWRALGDEYAEAMTQIVFGDCSQITKADDRAIVAYERAASLYASLKQARLQAVSLARLCVLNALLQKTDLAFTQCRAAKAIFQELKDAEGEKDLTTALSAAAESYLQLGLFLFQQRKAESLETALNLFRTARILYRELADDGKIALSLLSLGRVSSALGKKQSALDYYNEALPLYRKVGNRIGEATVLNNIGRIYSDFGERRKALDYYEKQALPIYREINDKDGIATTFINMGRVYDELGEKQKALDCYEKEALPLFEEINSKEGKATAFNNMGRVYSSLGEKLKALDYYENKALPLRKESGDKGGEAITLSNIGSVYFDLGDLQKAYKYYKEDALPLYRELGNRSGEATTLNNIGRVFDSLGAKDTALNYYEKQALPLFQEIKDKAGIATTFNNIGGVYADAGDNRKALDYYENQALSLYREIEDKAGIATTLNNIGVVSSALGDKQKALVYFEKQVLPLRKEIGDKLGAAATLNNIGRVYDDLGEKRKALDYYEKQALLLFKEVGEKSGIAITLNNIGAVYDDLGEKRKALDYYENRALPLFREIGDKSGMATTLNNIGRIYSDLGEKHKALDYYENQALPFYRAVHNKSGEGVALNNIGSIYAALGDRRKALIFYEQALPLYRSADNKSGEARTLGNIMVVWNDLGRKSLAIFYGKQCVNAYQQIRRKNQDVENEFQKTFLKSIEDFYRYLANMLIEKERLAEAVQVLDAFKDQRFFDFNLETSRKPLSLELTQREEESGDRYAAAIDKAGKLISEVEGFKLVMNDKIPGPENTTNFQKSENDMKAAVDELVRVSDRIETEFDLLPDPVKDAPPKIDEKRAMQEALLELNNREGRKHVVIYTLFAEEHFRALIITSDDLFDVSSLVNREKLGDKAKQLWALLQSDEYDPRTMSKEIWDVIFKPIENKLNAANRLEEVLPEGATIIWSLDGELRYVPMGALYDGKKYLVERYNNVVFTRAETKRWLRQGSSKWTGVGFGNSQPATVPLYPFTFPGLPNANKELRAIIKPVGSKAGYFEGDIYADDKFTREAMTVALRKQRLLVHITSHFYFSPGSQARSFLLLGHGEVFRLSEMKQYTDLFQGVELLTLSACETAAQWADSDGREVDGFAELAQRQGAASVIASLWAVGDESSYWLMRSFYQRKKDMPLSGAKIESLRFAQIALLNGTARVDRSVQRADRPSVKGKSTIVKILPEGKTFSRVNKDGVVYIEAKYAQPYKRSEIKPYAHPYFWAPFVLFGNWR